MSIAPVVSRTLATEYRLHLPTEADAERFRFIEASPQLPGKQDVVDIVFRGAEGRYAAELPRLGLADGDTSRCLNRLTTLLLRDQSWSHPGHPMVHGATLRIAGKRLLVVADKGTGKSTLVLHMLARGHDVEGDEHLVVLDNEVVARPRRLRIKPNSLDVVAGLPDAIRQSPILTDWNGLQHRSVDPAIFGRPWIIGRGKLDAILFAIPNRGGFSRLRPLAPEESFKRLRENGYLFEASVGLAIARLRALALQTPAFELRLGSLSSAETQLARLATA
jgi:energy-coupling factor transporter ATP-binding protein EcfA2